MRANSNHEIVNLADYRERHAQYKTDPDLQAAHAAFPWLVTFDDHEIDNNWAADIPEEGMPQDFFCRRRKAAFRAYWEHMPLRKAADARPRTASRSTGAAPYGNLATFHVMDTRQFRSDQACGDGTQAGCDDRTNPARTLTGAAQEQWLYDGLQGSPAKWQILAQQVFMAQRDSAAGAGETLQHGRLGRLQGLARQAAGLHRHAPDREPGRDHRRRAPELGRQPAARLPRRGRRRSSARSSSARRSRPRATAATRSNTGAFTENPWIKYNSQRRGYVRVALDQQLCRTDYRTLPYVKRPGAPITTHKSFVVEAGNPGLKDA